MYQSAMAGQIAGFLRANAPDILCRLSRCIVMLVSPARMGRRCGTQCVGSRRLLPMQSRNSGKWSSGSAGTKNSVSGAGRFQSSTNTEFVNTACGTKTAICVWGR